GGDVAQPIGGPLVADVGVVEAGHRLLHVAIGVVHAEVDVGPERRRIADRHVFQRQADDHGVDVPGGHAAALLAAAALAEGVIVAGAGHVGIDAVAGVATPPHAGTL